MLPIAPPGVGGLRPLSGLLEVDFFGSGFLLFMALAGETLAKAVGW